LFSYTYDGKKGIDIVETPNWRLVIRRLGAEVIGLRSLKHAIGLIWRDGLTDDPEKFWKSHATLLFPIVGGLHNHRSKTTQGDEVSFPGLHGFVRKRELELGYVGEVDGGFKLSYQLKSDDATKAMYSWDFVYSVEYFLDSNGLSTRITVQNTGNRIMPFQVGWHPGFALPFKSGTKADCKLKLPAQPITFLENDDDCKLTGGSFLVNGTVDFPFTERGLDRTYMIDLSNVEPSKRKVSLLDHDEQYGVVVSFADFPHLGIWSDAGAPFICIEPWQGMDDRVIQEPFDQKFGIVHLPPGAIDSRTASIQMITPTNSV